MEDNKKVWVSKKGPIEIKDMSDSYLQTALHSAERQFRNHTNISLEHAERSTMLWESILNITEEAVNRGKTLISLAERNPEKFDIVLKTWKLEKMPNA